MQEAIIRKSSISEFAKAWGFVRQIRTCVVIHRLLEQNLSSLRLGVNFAGFNSCGLRGRPDFVSFTVRAAPGPWVHLDALGNRGRTVAARGKTSREPDCILVRICHGFLGGVHRIWRVGQRCWAISSAEQKSSCAICRGHNRPLRSTFDRRAWEDPGAGGDGG